MNFKTLCSILLLTFAVIGSTNAQEKLGHANVELILAYMPESQAMQQTLQAFQTQLGKQLQSKEEYGRTKMAEYQEYIQLHPNATLENDPKIKQLQAELQKLDTELRGDTAKAEEKLMKKREGLLEPIVEKLNTALEKVAAAEGYDYVLNAVDGSGVSIVLKAPEKNDLTKKILIELGINIPEE